MSFGAEYVSRVLTADGSSWVVDWPPRALLDALHRHDAGETILATLVVEQGEWVRPENLPAGVIVSRSWRGLGLYDRTEKLVHLVVAQIVAVELVGAPE